MSGKPTVVSTFAGCGGSSLGYKSAGFKELLAIEWDDNAVETFKLNFPDVPVWKKDIQKISSEEILSFLDLKKGELDVLDGSPPCQGFSTAGKRKVNDSRNDLTHEFIRLINGLQPKVFLVENVSGMVKGKMKGRFKEIMTGLKSTGYNVKCKLLNSMHYNVPQARQRLIWIGVKNGDPVYPKPNNNIITVKQALEGVKNKTFAPDKKLRPMQLRDRVQWHKPAPTLTKMSFAIFGKCVVHPIENRHLTIEEAKRIASFPDDFKFIGKFDDQWARIGNAVMPNFMKEIALTIKKDILWQDHK